MEHSVKRVIVIGCDWSLEIRNRIRSVRIHTLNRREAKKAGKVKRQLKGIASPGGIKGPGGQERE